MMGKKYFKETLILFHNYRLIGSDLISHMIG